MLLNLRICTFRTTKRTPITLLLMKKTYLFLLFSFVVFTNVFSQDIKKTREDSLDSLSRKSLRAYNKGNYKDAIKYSAETIDKAVAWNNKYYEFVGYDSQSTLYFCLGDTLNTRINGEKALEIAKETKVDSLIAWSYLNLGTLFSDNQEFYEKGITYLKKSLEIYKKEDQHEDVVLIYINLAWTYLDHQRNKEAYVYLKKIKEIDAKVSITEIDKAYMQFLFGKYYFNTKQYDISEEQLSSASFIIDKDSLIEVGSENYKLLAEIYSKKKDFEKAYSTLEKYNHYNKKLYAIEELEEIEKASAKYNLKEYKRNLEALEAKKRSDEELKKTNNIKTIFIIASIILLLAVIGFILLNKARKKYIFRLKSKNLELTKAKEKTEKLSKVKTQFFSTVSHELRTPLYGVIGITSILRDDKMILERYDKDLKSLKFSADYLLALINDVLLINKMDAGTIKLKNSPFQLNDLINGVVNSFQFGLDQNNNKLHIEVDKEVPNNLIGDPIRFSQILINLIGNAIKFNENGNIWLTISLQEQINENLYKIYFEVKDDGIGIPVDKQKIIFKEFSQVINDNSSEGKGLGLPIVIKLLKLYNSTIHLDSDLGKGSKFSFTLDLLKNKDIISTINSDKVTGVSSSSILENKDVCILVVDDNKINQKVTQRTLKKEGIESALASDGQEAIDKVKNNSYDLILMDINMPKVNGIDATIAIRKFNKEIPIIALTAVELDDMRIKILDSGMNDILSKPYEIKQFFSTIFRYLKQ